MSNLLFAPPPALGTVLSLTGLPGGSNKIHDRSPYGNTGTITGATWVRLPTGLWCLSFDGSDDYVSVSNISVRADQGVATYEMWVKNTGNGTFFSDARSDLADLFMRHDISSNVLVAKVYEGVWRNIGTVNVGTTAWHHIAHTIDYPTDTRRLYVDGELDDSDSYTGAGLTNYTRCILGMSGAQTSKFNGMVALVRIYNRILSALEIQNHFNQEKHLFGVW